MVSEEEMRKIMKGVRAIGRNNAGVNEAAHLLAEAMKEGVVWSDTFKATELGECVRLMSRAGDTEIRTTRDGLSDGKEYRVTVRREGMGDGEGD